MEKIIVLKTLENKKKTRDSLTLEFGNLILFLLSPTEMTMLVDFEGKLDNKESCLKLKRSRVVGRIKSKRESGWSANFDFLELLLWRGTNLDVEEFKKAAELLKRG